MPGLQGVSPLRYEFAEAGFRPASELKLMILSGHGRFP